MSDRTAYRDQLGQIIDLEIRRFTKSGAYLAPPDQADETPSILLLGTEIPEGAAKGDVLSVFVYLDSEGRPLATTETPKLLLGQVAFLRVVARTNFGAFVDWGLPKELLVPFSEQTLDPEVGTRHPIGLYLDNTGRLAGTMRVTEMLTQDSAPFEIDQWVNGEAWRAQPDLGLFAILERSFVGLLPHEEPQSLARGDAARFRISRLLPDGKIVLSLRAHAHQELASDAERVLQFLKGPKPGPISDRSSPEQIRELFGLSKKAFKRAVGRLLKQRSVELDSEGYVRVTR